MMTRTAAISAAAGLLAAIAVTPAAAYTYITDTESFSSLGDTIGSPFDEVTLNGVTGTAFGPGTYLANTVDFTAGLNATVGSVTTGTFTDTATVDGVPYSYTVPYTLTIGGVDTIVIGGNSTIVQGVDVTFNTLTLTSGGSTVSGDLTATVVAVPEPATWAMMLVGIGGLGAVMRRRSSLAAI